MFEGPRNQTLARQTQVWRQMLADLHPKEVSAKEKERVALVEELFQREARVAVMLLISDLDRALESEKELKHELDSARRKLTDTNRLLKEAREKNAKLRKK
jgi:hypothetical protein